MTLRRSRKSCLANCGRDLRRGLAALGTWLGLKSIGLGAYHRVGLLGRGLRWHSVGEALGFGHLWRGG